MAELRNNPARSLAVTLTVLAFVYLATGCETREPRRPVFLPTSPPASPTPVYPSAPVDSGVNEGPCKSLAAGLSSSPKSNLRYGTAATFGRGQANLESARELMGESSDRELSESLDLLLLSIEQDDVGTAEAAAHAVVRRCKELGYSGYMAPGGFAVW